MAQASQDSQPAQAVTLTRCAVRFTPADPPRTGSLTFTDTDGRELELPIAGALTVLSRAPHAAGATDTARLWAEAATVALRLVAEGRLLPTVTGGGFDAWRLGPLEPADLEQIGDLAAALPARPGSAQNAQAAVREFLDAIADVLPRTPDSAEPFADPRPQHVPHLRAWAQELSAAGGVRVSLRLHVPDGSFDTATFRAVVQVHSRTDPTMLADVADLWAGTAPGFGPRAPVQAMLAVRRAAQVWPPLRRLLHRAVPDELELADDEVTELLGPASAELARAGVELHWPRELVRDLTARAIVGRPELTPSDLRTFFGGGELLAFKWQLALGGQPLTEAEMDRLAQAHRPVVRLRDQWLLLDAELARKARERALKPLTAIDALGAVLTGATDVDGERVEVAGTGWLDALRGRIADPDRADALPVPQPAALAATLRDYQLRGLRWLDAMTSLGLGACLADDMGLGKTITLIALHLHRQADPGTEGPTLVICPASLLGNWEREIRRFAPGTPVRRFHGAERSLDAMDDGFVLTTYGTMRLDAAQLGRHHWTLIVADEAQHVKNPQSATARALRSLAGNAGPRAARVALTGTPVENNLSELWAILDWTTPGLLGTLAAFRSRWAVPIEADRDAGTTQRLARLVRPFLLRRRKSDPGIAPELPPKTETDQPVELTHEQAALYEAVVRETMEQIRASTGMQRRGLVLKLLTALKQICNHPAQYLAAPGGQHLLAGRSGKLELLDELVDTIVAEDGAVLVFTQYVAMARLIERHLAARGLPAQLLHGGTPVRRREEMVQRFQDGHVPIFLLSLKAAGTGLNLTRADHVIHYDRWWNPAVEDQATDRAYRIGQLRPVQVHRLIAEGTLEDRIAEMLAAKHELATAVLGASAEDGDAPLTELSDNELADLVQLRRAR